MRKHTELSSNEVDELEKMDKNYHTDIECECGGHMILRENSANGNKFLGCSCYPKCKLTLSFAKTTISIGSGIYHVGKVANNVDNDMRYDAYNCGDYYGREYDNDDYAWGTNGGVYCYDDM